MPDDEGGAPAPEPRRQRVIWRPDQLPNGPGESGPAPAGPAPAGPAPAGPAPAGPAPAGPAPDGLGPGPGGLPSDVSAARLLLSSLVPAQLGLSLACLAVALVVTVSLPLIAALVPAVSRVTVAGLPVTLLLLGFGCYPVLFAVGWFYHRQARQLEARYVDLVAPPNPRPHV